MSKTSSNVWAFALFLIAAGLAIYAVHAGSKDLLVFAGGVTTTGSTLFRGGASESKSSGE